MPFSANQDAAVELYRQRQRARGARTLSADEEDVNERIRKRVQPYGLKSERLAHESQWIKNLQFFSGRQHYGILDGRFVEPPIDQESDFEVFYKVNLCRLSVLRAVSKVDAVQQRFGVAPQSHSIRHREIASISERLFRHQRDVMDFDYAYMLAGLWAAICGSGFLKIWWDPDSGDLRRLYLNDKVEKRPIPPEFLSEDEKLELDRLGLFEDHRIGDVAASVVTPFALYHDWSSRDRGIAGCQWVADVQYIDIELIADRWNVDPDDITPDEGTRGLQNYEEAIAFMSSISGFTPLSWNTPEDKVRKRALYVDMWDRPNRRWPRGRRTVWAGGLVLFDGDNPYVGDLSRAAHLPYVKRDWTPHPGRFWGGSLMEDLTSPQFNTNRAREKLLAFMEVFGCPPTFVQNNSNLSTDKMTTKAGAIYKVDNPGQNVKVGGDPRMPPEVAQILAVTESDIHKIASQSEIDGSKLPSQLRSGAALRTIFAERHAGLNLSVMCAHKGIRDAGRIALALGKLFYQGERVMQYVGDPGNEIVTETFTSADLSNDLRVLSVPGIEDTPEAERQTLLDLAQIGAINPAENPDDRMLLISGMQLGTSDEAYQAKLEAKRNQEREIQLMIRDPERYGETYPVAEFEDHETEARVVVHFMYSAQFRTLPPRTQAVIMRHWKQHTQKLEEKQAQMMQMLEAAKGAPGQKGTPSAPRR